MQHNFWLAKPYGLANQKLCYIQMLLDRDKSGEQDWERSKRMVVEYRPRAHTYFVSKMQFFSLTYYMKYNTFW